MKLRHVKYTKNGKPYVEFNVTSGVRKGYTTRRYGEILTCPACKEKFFARDEQLKRGIGKFCSIRCAKTFAAEIKRKEEISDRRSEKIKNRLIYFGEDGKIYTEKEDKKGKVYRYYGEIRRCAVCGEEFFASFSQMKLNRAKFCSRKCVNLKEESREIIQPYWQQELPVWQQEFYKRRKERMKEGMTEAEEPAEMREKPIGVLVFGICIIYIGLYHFIAGFRISSTIEGQFKSYLLAMANLILGYGILRMKPWVIKMVYVYLMIVAGVAVVAFYLAAFVEPSFRAPVFSRGFLNGLCLAFIPYIFVLAYLTHPEIMKQFTHERD